jgi:hypothetical protein
VGADSGWPASPRSRPCDLRRTRDPPWRWQASIDDIGRFPSRLRPGRFRPHAAGLLWLLNGDKLVALSENTAKVETPTGSRQTLRRGPSEPSRVLAWELAPVKLGRTLFPHARTINREIQAGTTRARDEP